MDASGQRLAPICDALARLLSPHAEVVLHDPATDEIVAIWNPLSGAREPAILRCSASWTN